MKKISLYITERQYARLKAAAASAAGVDNMSSFIRRAVDAWWRKRERNTQRGNQR